MLSIFAVSSAPRAMPIIALQSAMTIKAFLTIAVVSSGAVNAPEPQR
jgi:hypothetical protein